jgi:hypothetical protein
MTLRFQWRLPYTTAHTLPHVDLMLRHGDVYIMSEKATGHDWQDMSLLRLVHAAGGAQYIHQK